MKPLKVLVYEALVSAAKAQGDEPKVKPAVLVQSEITEYDNGSWFESGLVIFESGVIGYVPLDRIEVLTPQEEILYDSVVNELEQVITVDVPGAINTAMDN